MKIEKDSCYFLLFLIFITFILLNLIVSLFRVIKVGGEEKVFVGLMMMRFVFVSLAFFGVFSLFMAWVVIVYLRGLYFSILVFIVFFTISIFSSLSICQAIMDFLNNTPSFSSYTQHYPFPKPQPMASSPPHSNSAIS